MFDRAFRPTQGAPHLWLGTTVESQDYLHRLDSLCDVPAVVHFVSAEPQLEAMDFRPWFATDRFAGGPLNWIITGGESKQKKDAVPRPYNLAWALHVIDQGSQHGVPVFVKQLGSRPVGTTDWQRRACQAIRHRKGEKPDEWPLELQVRQFPQPRHRRSSSVRESTKNRTQHSMRRPPFDLT